MKTAQNINKKTKVGVLCGGLSNEREVSLRSGNNCLNALKRLGYENAELIDVGKDVSQVLQSKGIEVAFMALHGRYGEDGAMQGVLELLAIPYTGSGVLSSAVAMSKPLTKKLLSANNISSAPTIVITERERAQIDQILAGIDWLPAMVKPLNEGSSVGVHKVTEKSEIKKLVLETLDQFGGVLLEKFISGQEITVGVLEERPENRNGKDIWALPILELRPKSKAGFYDYEAKYTKGMTEFILPAELSKELSKSCQETAVATFKALNCSGYARVDMIVGSDGQAYVLEVNTLPGMTDTSDLPAMAQEAGIDYDQLVERILMSAGLDK
ncbi:MAG: D-alanine--D-alanine ligase [Candidatus Obscuribacterales bacterium]|nr:D-alanine--D-alanine ligase [Candidatus Obscuribacterales bacterium]